MAPGPLLAMVLDTVAGENGEGLAGLSDDQLVGFLSGTRRMESRLAWAKMAALAEFASRPRRQDFAADEVAAAFHLTWLSAAGEIGYARTVARRLPVTFAALAAGELDPVHVRIIEDVTSVLSDEDAALADEILAGRRAQSQDLRRAAPGREPAGAGLDPRRVAQAQGEGAAGGAGAGVPGGVRQRRDLAAGSCPSWRSSASMQHVEERARALRDAGVPGTWEELKVRATLDLLQERDSRPAAGRTVRERRHEDGDGPRPGRYRRPRPRRPGSRRLGLWPRPVPAVPASARRSPSPSLPPPWAATPAGR